MITKIGTIDTELFEDDVHKICDILSVTSNFSINFKQYNAGIDIYPSINFSTNPFLITIYLMEYWNCIYQVSHELLHLAFYEHKHISKNYNTVSCINVMWIEEIVCEAFSIFCLEKYAFSQYKYWRGYLNKKFYILNGNIKNQAEINTIEELNQRLKGYKDFESRQFIHPIALQISEIIKSDFNELLYFLNYIDHLEKNRISKDFATENKIAKTIYSFQTKLM